MLILEREREGEGEREGERETVGPDFSRFSSDL